MFGQRLKKIGTCAWKSAFILLLFLFLMSSCQEETRKITVEGSFPYLMNQRVVLYHMNSTSLEAVDSTTTDDAGRFRLRLKAEEPEFYSLRFADGKKSITLALHPGEKVVIDAPGKDFWINYRIKGSDDSDRVRELVQNQEEFQEEMKKLGKTFYEKLYTSDFPKVKEGLDSTYRILVKEKRDFTRQFILRNKGYLAGLMALYQQVPSAGAIRSAPVLSMEEDHFYYHLVDSTLNTLYPASTPVRLLRSQMISWEEQQKNKQAISSRAGVGSKAPELIMALMNGDTLRLSALRGHWVCLVFWASWDQKSRMLNKILRECYYAYHYRGVEFVQVSLDRSREAWIKAVADDRLSWYQAGDMKFWNSPAVRLFQVESLPLILIINPGGKIAVRDVQPEALNEIIRDLLKRFSQNNE